MTATAKALTTVHEDTAPSNEVAYADETIAFSLEDQKQYRRNAKEAWAMLNDEDNPNGKKLKDALVKVTCAAAAYAYTYSKGTTQALRAKVNVHRKRKREECIKLSSPKPIGKRDPFFKWLLAYNVTTAKAKGGKVDEKKLRVEVTKTLEDPSKWISAAIAFINQEVFYDPQKSTLPLEWKEEFGQKIISSDGFQQLEQENQVEIRKSLDNALGL
jgi:hypothetical protein